MQNVESWVPTKFRKTADGWAPSLDTKELAVSSRLVSGRALAAYLASIKAHARGHLADLGCGNAPLYGYYKDFVDQVTCVDWPGTLHKTNHIDIFGDLNSVLQIDDGSFDTILSTSVLEHIWRHDVFWGEMARLLKPGGRLLLGTPFLYHLHEEPYDFFRWTSHGLRRACEENDLTVIDLWPYGGGLDVVADVTIKLVARRSQRFAAGLNAIAEAMLRKGPLRRLSDSAAPKIPTGFMLVAEKGSKP